MNREIVLGTTASNDRVTVKIELREVAAAGRQTIDHQTLTGKYMTELSVMGNVYEKAKNHRYYSEPYRGGQCIEALLEIVTPQAPWTLKEIADLHATWKRWHLNDAQAGCVHQTRIVWEDSDYGKRIDLDATTAANDCPAGYRYGSAWLVEPLPADVIEKVQRWQRRLKP